MPLAFQSVSHSYHRRSKKRNRADAHTLPWALRGIDLTLAEGEFLAIAGRTGSGKTTLLQLFGGLLEPSEGHVLWNDVSLSRNGAAAHIGSVFQYPERQLFAPTVAQDVAFGPRNQGLSADEVDRRVRQSLSDVGLPYGEFADASPFSLSGGQQRRVALAGVLAMEPTVLVLDEPTAGLDPRSHDELLALIASLNQRGTTVVMASHDMVDIARWADRLLVLDAGSIAFLADPQELFAHHGTELQALGLAVPPAQRMADELRSQGFALPEGFYSPERLADELAALLDGRKAMDS